MPITRTQTVATAITLAIAFAAIVWARAHKSRYRTVDGFVPAASTEVSPAYGGRHADVFRAFIGVHGAPPSELAMRHYLFIQRTQGLDADGIASRIKQDLDPAMIGEDD